MVRYKCDIHDTDKPEVCRLYPQAPSQLRWDEEGLCGYTFDDNNVRHGECLRCGGCCMKVAIKLSDNASKYYERCPHLVEVGDD